MLYSRDLGVINAHIYIDDLLRLPIFKLCMKSRISIKFSASTLYQYKTSAFGNNIE